MYPKQLSRNMLYHMKNDPKYEVDADDYKEAYQEVLKEEDKLKEIAPSKMDKANNKNKDIKNKVKVTNTIQYRASKTRGRIAHYNRQIKELQSKIEEEYKKLGKLLY